MVTFTWNNIVKYFETIAEHHYQIKGFGSGFVDDIQATLKKNTNYPFMYVIPLDDTVRENTNDARVGVIIVDLVKEDHRNQLEVLSDTNLIVKDIIKILRNEEVSNIQVLDEPTMEPFKERYADDTTGWVIDLSLQINFPNNYCDIPSDIFGPGGTETGLPSFSTNFLTCETLEDCERIVSIVAELADHEERITALEQGGGGGLTCDDLENCQTILDILTSISDHDIRLDNLEVGLQAHIDDLANPHQVTKDQVGLSNVDNTSDANKPVSTAQQAALDLKLNKTDYSVSLQGFALDTTVATSDLYAGRTFNQGLIGAWADGRSIVSPFVGTLVGAMIEFSNSAGSNEPTTLSIRKNNVDDIEITTVADFSQTYHVYRKMDLNSSAGLTDKFQLKIHGRSRSASAALTKTTVHLFFRPTL